MKIEVDFVEFLSNSLSPIEIDDLCLCFQMHSLMDLLTPNVDMAEVLTVLKEIRPEVVNEPFIKNQERKVPPKETAPQIVVQGDYIAGNKIVESISTPKSQYILDAGVSPYKFLFSYTSEDSEFFHGREMEVVGLQAGIRNSKFSIIYGVSGVGKSSIVSAGALPALTGEFNFFSFVNYKDFSLPNNVLGEKKRPTVLFFDQFERFFQQDVSIQENFYSLIRDLAKISYLRFVFSVRSDFLGSFGEFFIETDIHHGDVFHFYLKPLTRESAKHAIERPLSRLLQRIEYNEAFLSNTLLKDLSSEDGRVMPSRMQIVCCALFDAYRDRFKSSKDKHKTFFIDQDIYSELGESEGILSNYLNNKLSCYGSQEGVAKEILKEMIYPTPNSIKIKRFVTTEQLCFRHDSSTINRTLERLMADRLIEKQISNEDVVSYTLAHDHMIANIEKWYLEGESKVRRVHDLLKRAYTNWLQIGSLLDKESVELIESTKLDITPTRGEVDVVIVGYIYNDLDPAFWKQKIPSEDYRALVNDLLTHESPEHRIAGIKGFKYF